MDQVGRDGEPGLGDDGLRQAVRRHVAEARTVERHFGGAAPEWKAIVDRLEELAEGLLPDPEWLVDTFLLANAEVARVVQTSMRGTRPNTPLGLVNSVRNAAWYLVLLHGATTEPVLERRLEELTVDDLNTATVVEALAYLGSSAIDGRIRALLRGARFRTTSDGPEPAPQRDIEEAERDFQRYVDLVTEKHRLAKAARKPA